MDVFDLQATLGINTSGYEKGLSNAKSAAETFAKVGSVALAGISAATVAAGTKLVKSAKDVAAYGDNVDKTSQKIGISAKAYQEWSYVFERSGASIDNLKMGMKTLRTAMDDLGSASGEAIVDQEKLAKAQLNYNNKLLDAEQAQKDYDNAVSKNGETSDEAQKALIKLQKANNDVEISLIKLNEAAEGETPKLSDAAKALSKLGISAVDANGNLRDGETVFSEVVTALQGMGNETKRARYASLLLGRSATDMAAVFNMTAEETENLKQEVQDYGMVMSDKAVKSSAAFEDSLTKMNSTIRGTKNSMMGELLPGITSIINGISDLIVGNDKASQELKSGVDSVVKSLTKMMPKIVTLFSSIAEAVLENAPEIISSLADGILSALPNLVPTIVTTITSLINTIVELLPQIVETGAQLLTALLNGIAEALPTLIPAITEVVSQVVITIVDNLPMILEAALKVIEALGKGLIEALPTLISKLPEIITGIVNFILGALPTIIQVGIELFLALVKELPTIIKEICKAIPKIIEGIITAIVTALPQIIQAGIDLFLALIENLPTIIVEICKAIPKIIEGIITALINSIPQIIQAGIDLFVSLITNLPTIIVEICKAIPQIIKSLVEGFVGSVGKIIEAGVKLFTALIENLPTIIEEICKAAPEIIQALVSAFGELGGEMLEIGSNLVSGIWQGISGAASWLWEQVSGWLSGLWDGIKDFFGIASPSKEMAWIGEMLVSGLSGAIDKNGDQAVKSAMNMAGDVEKAFESMSSDISTSITPEIELGDSQRVIGNYLTGSQAIDTVPPVRGAQVINYNFEVNVESVNAGSDSNIEDLADRLMVVMQEKIIRMGSVFA